MSYDYVCMLDTKNTLLFGRKFTERFKVHFNKKIVTESIQLERTI